MTALSDNLLRQSQGIGSFNFVVKNGSTVYPGSLVGLERATGHIVPLDDSADRAYLGVCQTKVVGDGTLKAIVSLDKFILPGVAVTGASAMTDIGNFVYATDDGTGLTLTRPADDACPIGRVLYWYSSTTCDVAMFDMHTSFNMSAQGRGRQVITLPAIDFNVVTGNAIASFEMHGHGLIKDFFGFGIGQSATGVGADHDYNLEINGTNLTGGVLEWLLADATAAGVKKSASAITAGNEYHDGDLLDVEVVVNTAFTAGVWNLCIEVEPLP